MFKPRENFVWCPRRICNKFLIEEKANDESDATQVSSDSNGQSDQIKSRVQDQEDVNTQIRNDENVSGECQDPEVLPVTAAGNVNSSDTSEDIKAPSTVDSEPAGHVDSKHKAAIQKDEGKAGNQVIPNSAQKAKEKPDEVGNEDADATKETNYLSGDKNFDNTTASDNSTNENFTQTSNHSENSAIETPLLGANSRSENQGDESQIKSQHTDGDSKDTDLETIQKSGCETPKDATGTGTETSCYNAETSADKNKYGLYPEESSRPSRSFEQISEQNLVSSKKIHTSGSDRNVQDEHQDSNQGDGLANEVKALGNLDERSEQRKQGHETLNQLKPTTEAKEQINEKEDLVHRSNEDNAADRLIDGSVSNIPSLNNEHVDAADVMNSDCTQSEQSGTALRSDVNMTQDILRKNTDTAESSNVKSVEDKMTDIGCVRGIGITEKEENI